MNHQKRYLSASILLLIVCCTFCTAGFRAPGNYCGVIIFDRWDGCILYSGTYLMYVSRKIKEQLRPYEGQSIQVKALDVFQPENPGDGLIRKLKYLGPAPSSKHLDKLKNISLKSHIYTPRGKHPIGVITIRNQGLKQLRLSGQHLAFTVLTKTPKKTAAWIASDGPSFALITRVNFELRDTDFRWHGRGVSAGIPYSWTTGKDMALSESFMLTPGAEKQIEIHLDLPDGQYNFLCGYGGGVHENNCLTSNCSSFDIQDGIAREVNERVEAEKLFVSVEKVYRLKKSAQKEHLSTLYRITYPRIEPMLVCCAFFTKIPKNRLAYSPKELAEHIVKQKHSHWGQLVGNASITCRKILLRHPDILIPLVEQDLVCTDSSSVKRGLNAIREFRLKGFYDPVLRIFNQREDLAQTAAHTLSAINNPSAIEPMIRKYPDLQTHSIFEELRDLQQKRKASPLLIQCLRSNNASVRWRAAYALCGSGDPDLIPHLKRIIKDRNRYVRKQALYLGFSMRKKYFSEIRSDLTPLLSDPNLEIQKTAAILFAQKKDNVCALTLLELIQNEAIAERDHRKIVEAVENLTGTRFGYSTASGTLQPVIPVNRKAILKFAAWIEKHLPDADLQYQEDRVWTSYMLKKRTFKRNPTRRNRRQATEHDN